MNRIFPRNLTALASIQVAGNPVTTRLESGVSNCFPGLEFDHRNLDRRFFPGLVFEFVSSNQDRLGARLVAVETNDPDLAAQPDLSAPDKPNDALRAALATILSGKTGKKIGDGTWFLNAITQAGKSIRLDGPGVNDRLDGITVWRLVRSLQRSDITIEIVRRQAGVAQPGPVTLNGWRRVYTSSTTGVINPVYSAGELTQSLCSPWMHDFRDCACFYWASNHPDIVLAEDQPGDFLPDGSPADPNIAGTPVDWLRSDHSPVRSGPALDTEGKNRAAQMDHYQINQTWQDLPIVLLNQETTRIFQPRPLDSAMPFASPSELVDNLKNLAGLEHAVMLEYLYARYSVLLPVDATPQPLSDDATFIRHEMLLIAVSEMRHLRWVNQLLWELEHNNLIPSNAGPVLDVAQKVPAKNGLRDRALRTLTSDVLDDFIAVEQPSGTLDGQYARVVATLRDKNTYPPESGQLAERILADGISHFTRFRQIRAVLKPYFDRHSTDYLINLTPASPTSPDAKTALDEYHKILDQLKAAYAQGDAEDFQHIAVARATMFTLETAGNSLAGQKLGIPFF